MATKTKAVEPVKATPQPQPKAQALPPPTQAFEPDSIVVDKRVFKDAQVFKASPAIDEKIVKAAAMYMFFSAEEEDQSQWPSFDKLDAITQANYAEAVAYALDAKNEARTDFEKFVKANCAGKQIL